MAPAQMGHAKQLNRAALLTTTVDGDDDGAFAAAADSAADASSRALLTMVTRCLWLLPWRRSGAPHVYFRLYEVAAAPTDIAALHPVERAPTVTEEAEDAIGE